MRAQLPELDALRGWAILLVVVFHYVGILGLAQTSGAPLSAPWALLAATNTGVSLFFVLSGFLLALGFFNAAQQGQRLSLGQFYWARFWRIVPLYYLAVLSAWLISGNNDALLALGFMHIGFAVFPYSVPWWSLSTEVQFYLTLPVIMWALGFKAGRWALVLALGVWLSSYAHYATDAAWMAEPAHSWVKNSVFGRGGAFLFGALAAWLYSRPQFLITPRTAVLSGAFALMCLAQLLICYGQSGALQTLLAMPWFYFAEGALWAALLLCLLALPAGLKKIFSHRLLAHFGRISYSLYLLHVPIQFYLIYPVQHAGQLSLTLAVLGSFCLAWLLAWLCYRFIERPFLTLKGLSKRLSHPARAPHTNASQSLG